jgi:hypothetical protein
MPQLGHAMMCCWVRESVAARCGVGRELGWGQRRNRLQGEREGTGSLYFLFIYLFYFLSFFCSF